MGYKPLFRLFFNIFFSLPWPFNLTWARWFDSTSGCEGGLILPPLLVCFVHYFFSKNFYLSTNLTIFCHILCDFVHFCNHSVCKSCKFRGFFWRGGGGWILQIELHLLAIFVPSSWGGGGDIFPSISRWGGGGFDPSPPSHSGICHL